MEHSIIDISVPNAARVYDCWAGGKDNFDADRAVASEMERLYPPIRALVASNREFLKRAVTWAARQGITQFIDLGAGLPAPEPLHQVARAISPAARYAYVDTDRLVASHARALLTGPGVCAVEADLTNAGPVLTHPDLLAGINPRHPVCVLLGCVCHFMDSGEAAEAVAGYAHLIAPGSVVAISVARNDDTRLREQMEGVYTAAPVHNHTADEVARFLDGLQIVPPGVVLAHAWRGDMPGAVLAPDVPAYVLAAVGRKI